MSVTAKRAPKSSRAQKSAEPTSRGKKNVEAIQAAYTAFHRGDTDAFLAVLDPKVEWDEPSGTLPPPAGGGSGQGAYHGREAVKKEIIEAIPRNWADFDVEPDTFLDAGDHVIVMGNFHVRPKNGRAVEAPCVQVWKMSRGKAVRMVNYTDTARLAAAFPH